MGNSNSSKCFRQKGSIYEDNVNRCILAVAKNVIGGVS